jgi:3-hydroxyisobutyrate dehydrogenase
MGDVVDERHPLPRVGFVGIGRMSGPMCANLVRAGYAVLANDRRADRAAVARACGASWSPTTTDAARNADVLITMLPGPQEVRAVMLETGRAIDAMAAGTTWIDMTSNSPVVAGPIRERALARGIHVLEAPVGGGIPAAREGTLKLFVGGDAEVFERCRPLLEVLGDPARIVRVGGPGTGYTAKLLVNLLWFGQAVATAEALLLGQSAGIELGTLRRALADSAAGSAFIGRDLDALLAGDYLTSFGLDRVCEELSTITALAREHEVPFELSDLVEGTYRRALTRFGAVDGELLGVALLEEEAGRLLRAD